MFMRNYIEGPRTRIAGLGVYLPEQTLGSDEIEERIIASGVTVKPGFIRRSTGIASRRIAATDENASDLAAAAAGCALADAAVDPSDVDLLIFAAASHDIIEPATANILQQKLGTRNAQTYDVKNACNSFLSGVDIGNAYIRAGMADVVLVATGEIPSRACDLHFSSHAEITKKFSHLTMGDAGGAAVLTRATGAGDGVLATAGITKGEKWRLGTILTGGTMYPRDVSPARGYLRSRGCELEECGRQEVPQIVQAVLAEVGWTADSVDVVATQQHTNRIVAEVVGGLGIPAERAPLPLRYAGNSASANVPLALAEARENGMLESGARAILLGASSGFSVMVSAVSW